MNGTFHYEPQAPGKVEEDGHADEEYGDPLVVRVVDRALNVLLGFAGAGTYCSVNKLII